MLQLGPMVVVLDAGIGATNVGVVAVADNSAAVEAVDKVVPVIVVVAVVATVVAADGVIFPDQNTAQYFEMAFVHFPMVVEYPNNTAVE